MLKGGALPNVKDVGHSNILADHDLIVAYAARLAGDLTTASAVLVDATSLTVSFTLRDWTSGKVHILISGTHANNAATNINTFAILVDGVKKKEVDAVVATANAGYPIFLEHYVTGLGKGSHTVKLQWKTAGGTATILGATVATRFTSILVRELP